VTKIIFGKSFATALKKLLKGNATLEKTFAKKLEVFGNDPFDPQLRTHNLKGDLKSYRSFSITHEIRVVFKFTDEGYALFTDIGTHDEVY
jgi:addiction module RelE/StbE family toxin